MVWCTSMQVLDTDRHLKLSSFGVAVFHQDNIYLIRNERFQNGIHLTSSRSDTFWFGCFTVLTTTLETRVI